MLGLLTRSRRPRPAPRPHSVRLALECLERRNLLAAPIISTFTATTLPGHVAQLSGTVFDESPRTVQITFSGAVSGTTTADSSGHFSYSTTNAVLGVVHARALDNEGLYSAMVDAVLSNGAPAISNFVAVQGADGYWTFKGTVNDQNPGTCTVTLTGLPQLNGQKVSVAADGTFSYTVWLPAGTWGTVGAQATDEWGLTSNEAMAMVN